MPSTVRKPSRSTLASVERSKSKNRRLKEFTYFVSHDLQEPLRNLGFRLRRFEKHLETASPDEARENLEQIEAAPARMEQLVRDLQSLSQLDGIRLERAPVSIDRCLDRVQEALEQRIADTQAILRRPSFPRIEAHETSLTQICQNLIGNALMFRHPDRAPCIELTVDQSGEACILGVKDNGIGIPPESVDRVFGAFERLHGRSQFEGSGIGLTICQRAVELHQGSIWVEVPPGRGLPLPGGTSSHERPLVPRPETQSAESETPGTRRGGVSPGRERDGVSCWTVPQGGYTRRGPEGLTRPPHPTQSGEVPCARSCSAP